MLLDTPVCNFGWKAPDFTLKNAYGESFSMSDHLGDKGLLIVFICNHCPYVQRIGQRLAEDTALLMNEGINVLAIMSNDYTLVEADSPDNMKQFAKQYGFTFPYLIDEDQSVGQQYGAVCTPDFFGFNHQGELQYRGRLDDARMDDSANRIPELINAMRMIAETGQGPQTQVPSMGCSIKWRTD
ncbi:thioredoxin family protein [Pontibacterium sp. N1Y112]|uniref:Thioredoxin family protein n=1 Tax=Pontibacterium sinense TaxID=2781979 RepID=A0A8J7JZZ4_9GAMM|nr:thioredoxin family protein [Pontibacterium sinense]MBE9398339.1 thioredoxin family protein [Pontibacterium sinense]